MDVNLNHHNLAVSNVAETRAFLERYLKLRCERPHDSLSILTDDAGFVLTLMKSSDKDAVAYPENFHLGFYVDESTVQTIHEEMCIAGINVGEITTIRRGTMFYVTSPGGILIEVCWPRAM
jgi:lactoylglutathione lyase